MSDTHHLLTLCYELHSKGITPSVGLVRARSSKTVSLQQAIKAVQQFQEGAKPPLDDTEATTQTKSALSLEDRVTELERQVQELTSRLKTLQKSTD